MKSIYYLLMLITFVSCKEDATIKGDSSPEEIPAAVVNSPSSSSEELQELKSVEDIQKEFSHVTTRIENSSMDSTTFNYNCNDEKNGRLTYFFEDGQLRMIKHTYNEYSHFSAVDQYYVKNGELFFVFHNRLTWGFVNQNQTQDNITETRFYIIDKEPVKCLEKKFTVESGAKDVRKINKSTNQVIPCPSLAPVVDKYELLVKHQDRQGNLDCLEE